MVLRTAYSLDNDANPWTRSQVLYTTYKGVEAMRTKKWFQRRASPGNEVYWGDVHDGHAKHHQDPVRHVRH